MTIDLFEDKTKGASTNVELSIKDSTILRLQNKNDDLCESWCLMHA